MHAQILKRQASTSIVIVAHVYTYARHKCWRCCAPFSKINTDNNRNVYYCNNRSVAFPTLMAGITANIRIRNYTCNNILYTCQKIKG